MRETVSNTLRRDFTRCRKFYHFRYNEKLEPIFTAPNLSFGKLIHRCLELFYTKKLTKFDDAVEQWRADYVKEIITATQEDPDVSAEIDEEKIEKLAELAKGMLSGYVEKHGSDLEKWEILAAEEPFRYPIHVPCAVCKGTGKDSGHICYKCGGTGIGQKSPKWDQVGILDLVIKDEDGIVWIFDHKTTSETDPLKYENNLLLDTQPRAYVWALRQLAKENGWGKVGGILYNVMRKKIPADPYTLKCKSCKGTGEPTKKAQKEGHLDKCPTCNGTGIVGISEKQGTDTTYEKYVAVFEHYPHLNIHDYEDTLNKLKARGDRFFWRFYHHVSDADLLDWELETYQVTRDIATTQRYYRNPDACVIYGSPCVYRRICTEDDSLARRNFKIRDEYHPEIKAEEIDVGF